MTIFFIEYTGKGIQYNMKRNLTLNQEFKETNSEVIDVIKFNLVLKKGLEGSNYEKVNL